MYIRIYRTRKGFVVITLNMIKAGYDAGVVKLIESPHNDGVVCGIGEHWFYFGGLTGEEHHTVQEYKQNVSKEVITKEIFEVLEEFEKSGEAFLDEYLYYEAFLRENGINEKVLDNNPEELKPFRIVITETYVKEVEIYASDSVEAEQKAHDLCSAGKINLDFDNFVDRNTECRGLSRENDLKLHEVFGKDDEVGGYAAWEPFTLSREECDDLVDKALSTIKGIGVTAGSGYYGLKSFVLCDEKLTLYCEVCKLINQDLQQPYYSVYYAVEYDEGDNLFADWVSIENLDLKSLRDKVYEISVTDFSKDIEKIINQNFSLEEQIDIAKAQVKDEPGAKDIEKDKER